ncbi:MAG: phage holin family protein [Candidatus Yanofskybacteria bacterium]|nr:phage holin family protein [Candidatus Yanofskybacteria bacterium]
MIGFIIRIFGNSLALYAAYWLVPGFVINGGWKEYLLAGAFLGLLNLVVKPPLKMISMPIIILTLGLFTLVINGLLLWTVDYIFDFMSVRDTTTLLYAVVIVSIVNLFVSAIAKALK